MDVVFDFIIKHKDAILEGILIAIVSSFIIAILSKIIQITKKNVSHKPLLEPEEQAIYLSIPQKSLVDNCMGRYELLEKVFNKITDGKKNLFIRKCIAVTGEEGIGKTLFCYTLFQYHLRKCPIYLGWIECNGKQSIFDIIKNTFKDSRFHRKSKDSILNAFNSINKPCILFVDQIDQYTPIDELEEIFHCPNVILIISGVLRKINFVDYSFELTPLSEEIVRTIFEKQSGEDIYLMKDISRKSVKYLLGNYAKGNPFLTIAFAKAKYHYNGRWENVLKNMERLEYNDDENYLKRILRQLYKINELDDFERDALSQLSTIQYKYFVEVVFELFNISDYYAKRLCNTYWLMQEDNILYLMDQTHRKIIDKVLSSEVNLKSAINAIYISLLRWGVNKDNGFKWISPYVEDILKKIQGYAPYIMDEEMFSKFACEIAANYEKIGNKKKCLDWIKLCKLQDTKLAYEKIYIELRVKTGFINTLFSVPEVNQSYLDLWRKIETNNDDDKKRDFCEEYCFFLIGTKRYEDAISLCKEYFETYDIDLSNKYNCDMFFRYLQVANLLDDEESLKRIVSDATIQDLYQNDKVSITAAWSFGELSEIYKKWGNKEASDKYVRHMVVLLNEERCFFHKDIKVDLKISDEEFAEYMHSCNELLESLEDALQREDAEALYIEGRYQEKYRNYDNAIMLYEKAATRDSLRGMCSLALLYYRGQGEPRDYDKARKYWEYCCERGHRGSYYWLGILLLDKNYSYPDRDYDKDKELALQHLTKAAELGSKHAKQKLSEF